MPNYSSSDTYERGGWDGGAKSALSCAVGGFRGGAPSDISLVPQGPSLPFPEELSLLRHVDPLEASNDVFHLVWGGHSFSPIPQACLLRQGDWNKTWCEEILLSNMHHVLGLRNLVTHHSPHERFYADGTGALMISVLRRSRPPRVYDRIRTNRSKSYNTLSYTIQISTTNHIFLVIDPIKPI